MKKSYAIFIALILLSSMIPASLATSPIAPCRECHDLGYSWCTDKFQTLDKYQKPECQSRIERCHNACINSADPFACSGDNCAGQYRSCTEVKPENSYIEYDEEKKIGKLKIKLVDLQEKPCPANADCPYMTTVQGTFKINGKQTSDILINGEAKIEVDSELFLLRLYNVHEIQGELITTSVRPDMLDRKTSLSAHLAVYNLGTAADREQRSKCFDQFLSCVEDCPGASQSCLTTEALSITEVWHKRQSLLDAHEEITIRDIVNVEWVCTKKKCASGVEHCNLCEGKFFMQVMEDVNIGIPLVDRSNKLHCSSWDIGVDATCSGIEPGSEYLVHGSVRSDSTHYFPGFYIEMRDLQKCSARSKFCPELPGKVCSDGTYLEGDPYNNCEVPLCPTEQKCNNGCFSTRNDRCVSTGFRLKEKDASMYCDIDSMLKQQKPDGSQASNSYECLSNFQSDGTCVSVSENINLLQRIVKWFSRIFGGN